MNPTPVLRADSEARLRAIFASVLGVGLDDVGPLLERSAVTSWSSLNHLLLISEIELRFDVTFTNADIAAIAGYADLSAVLARRLEAAAGRS